MSLATIVAKIKEIKPYIDEDVESGPLETMSGRRGRKNQAINEMANLKRSYKEQMLNNSLFIVVSGASKDGFATIATENFKCLSADPEEFYMDLVNRIPPSLYLSGSASVENVFDVLGRHLEDKAMELGLVQINQPVFKQEYRQNANSKEKLLALVKQIVNEQVGAEIVGFQAVHSLTAPAIEKGHKEVLSAIILPTDDEKLVKFLINDFQRKGRSQKVFLISAGKTKKEIKSMEGVIGVKEVNETSVKAALTQILSFFKK